VAQKIKNYTQHQCLYNTHVNNSGNKMHIESSNGITDFTITVNVNVSRMKQINKPD